MIERLHLLLTRSWWTCVPGRDWFVQPYHWFNLAEGCFWLLLATLVLWRYLRHRCSAMELLYALAFVTFALSDFREAYVLQSWLILFKGLNLLALVALRRAVLRRCYPESKTF